MTSHSFVSVSCRAQDVDALRELFGAPPDEPTTIDAGLATLTYYSTPSGLWQQREDAAAQGFSFCGTVGSSSEGDPSAFIAIDGELVEAPTDEGGALTCRLDDDGEPLAEDLERARRYIAAKRRVAAAMQPASRRRA